MCAEAHVDSDTHLCFVSVVWTCCCAKYRYIPAEVLKGDVTDLQKSDMFMLGITLYELATNKELPTGER